MNVLGTINITERQMAFEKKPNCKFTCAQVIQMMILFPFFSVKNAANYVGSSLQSLFDCHKDMFYRVLSNDRIDWRHILRYVNKKLVLAISVRSDARNSEYPVCMIADDTDILRQVVKARCLDAFTPMLQVAEASLVTRTLPLSYRWSHPDAC